MFKVFKFLLLTIVSSVSFANAMLTASIWPDILAGLPEWSLKEINFLDKHFITHKIIIMNIKPVNGNHYKMINLDDFKIGFIKGSVELLSYDKTSGVAEFKFTPEDFVMLSTFIPVPDVKEETFNASIFFNNKKYYIFKGKVDKIQKINHFPKLPTGHNCYYEKAVNSFIIMLKEPIPITIELHD